MPSPSTRRAWIEIQIVDQPQYFYKKVALHPEGVDRNSHASACASSASVVALHPEGVDRNWGKPVESWKEG